MNDHEPERPYVIVDYEHRAVPQNCALSSTDRYKPTNAITDRV